MQNALAVAIEFAKTWFWVTNAGTQSEQKLVLLLARQKFSCKLECDQHGVFKNQVRSGDTSPSLFHPLSKRCRAAGQPYRP